MSRQPSPSQVSPCRGYRQPLSCECLSCLLSLFSHPHYLWLALPLARDGTVCSSLAEHLMVDSAIIISHPSVNNHYCLLTSLFMRSTVTKMIFLSCFPCGSLFYRPSLNLAQLYSVPENYSSFNDVQH